MKHPVEPNADGTITIPPWDSFFYVSVHRVISRRDGLVYKTKPIGYAHRDRAKGEGEVYGSISTSITATDEATITVGPYFV